MSAAILVIGASHKTAPLALRERLALPEGRAAHVLSEIVAHPEIREAVAISTCNRTEIYMVVGDPVEAESAALGCVSRQVGMRPTELVGSLYSHRDAEAVRHLFEVAAGLDSMIVGEAEVLGQVKRAYELALVEGATGPISNRLFRDAIATGKRVRTETALGRARDSVSSVAVDLARSVLGDLAARTVLVIGAGETAELTAKALHQRGADTVFVANRRYDRAIGLAQKFGGHAVRFEDLPSRLLDSDIVVSSTASPHQIVGREELAEVMEQRGGRPLLIVDMAVPRDIDAAVRDVPGVALYDMDDLQREAARNLSVQEVEATRARSLVDGEADRFARWAASLDVIPTVAALRDRGDAIVRQVLRENESRWVALGEEDRARVELLARAVVSRLLHEPTLRLKAAAGDDSYVYVQALRELFGIDAAELEAPAEAVDAAAVTSLDDRRRRQSR
jgi:glutamyl-tRNA reductase